MNSNRKAEIVREDKKWSKRFFLWVIFSGFIGVLCGLGLIQLNLIDPTALDWLSGVAIPVIALIVLWLGNLVAVGISSVYLHQARGLAAVSETQEELYSSVEEKAGVVLTATTIQTVIAFTCFGIAASIEHTFVVSEGQVGLMFTMVAFFGALVGLIFALVSVTMLQHRAVNLLKELNPEKHGSVFQFRFAKVWLASCDEAERQQIYQAGFRAYRAGNYACLTVWVFGVFGLLLDWCNWSLILFIGIIWLVMQVAYCVNCRGKMQISAVL